MLNQTKKALFLLVGLISLALGIIGIFLPLLPTTPFLLLSAYCFSQSSKKLHQWLLSHKYFGPLISDWEKHGVIRTKVKWLATISMVVLISYPLLFMIQITWLKAFIVLTMSCVLIFIWTRPALPRIENTMN